MPTDSGTTSPSWQIEFEGLPPSPNDRLNDFVKRQRIRQWRETTASATRELGIPSLNRARLTFTVLRRNMGVADEDNDRSRFKAVVDGLRDAYVLTNDTRAQVVYGPCREAKGKPQGFVLLIEPIDLECSKCGARDVDVESFLDWALCLGCYGKMAMAFLMQEKGNLVDWISGGKKSHEHHSSSCS